MPRKQDSSPADDATTPLLGNKNFNVDDDQMGGSHSREPEWPGQADLEGLPWRKTPSVWTMSVSP